MATLLTEAETCDAGRKVGGFPGPGRWLVFEYLPVSLFSLKASSASSGVGRTLLVPTPYAVKMGFLDAGLTTGLIPEESAPGFVELLRGTEVRIGVPAEAVVTHTIVKIQQEPKAPVPGSTYTPNVAYREFVSFAGKLRLAFDLHGLDASTAERIGDIAPSLRYLGKRGGFIQFTGRARLVELDESYTVDIKQLVSPVKCHLAWLDDFGPEASFDALNSYSKTPIKRDKHRRFVQTVIPLGLVNVGPGFTHYRNGRSG